MIVTADWVLPVSAPPIRNGAVLVRGGTIAEVGPLDAVSAGSPGVPVDAHEGCTIIPGLVNAHTHLALTALEGLLPPLPFHDWLARIAPVTRGLTREDFRASAALGALRCLGAGITVVGDIAYGAESAAAAEDLGLGGVSFWEALGLAGDALDADLERRGYPAAVASHRRARLIVGLSPHAPYTAGPGLLRATAERARADGVPWMIHLAESPAESRLLVTGDGPLAAVAARLAVGFEPPGTGAVAYADALGALDGAIAVHCVEADAAEIALLAESAAGVVLCPRSNAYLGDGEAPVAALRRAGNRLALGSDSLASNESIDLLAEARAARRLDPGLEAGRLLAMLTLEGARVLGIDDRFGSLEPGKQADLAVLRLEGGDPPVETLIAHGSPEAVAAVMSAGEWRVRDGTHLEPTGAIERDARLVAERASAVIGAGG